MAGLQSFVFSRGQPDLFSAKTRNFAGITYYTRFYVNRPIIITNIGFFGPAQKESGHSLPSASRLSASKKKKLPISGRNSEKLEAWVKLEIRESRYNNLDKPDAKLRVFLDPQYLRVNVTAFQGGSVFFANVLDGQGVLIDPDIIIDIGFQLEGVLNKDLKFHHLPDDHPAYLNALHDESNTEFTFLNSSKQVACLRFHHVNTNGVERNTDAKHEPETVSGILEPFKEISNPSLPAKEQHSEENHPTPGARALVEAAHRRLAERAQIKMQKDEPLYHSIDEDGMGGQQGEHMSVRNNSGEPSFTEMSLEIPEAENSQGSERLGKLYRWVNLSGLNECVVM